MPQPPHQQLPPAPKPKLWQEILESLRELGTLGKPCTCGVPNKIGPCPRHGTLN